MPPAPPAMNGRNRVISDGVAPFGGRQRRSVYDSAPPIHEVDGQGRNQLKEQKTEAMNFVLE